MSLLIFHLSLFLYKWGGSSYIICGCVYKYSEFVIIVGSGKSCSASLNQPYLPLSAYFITFFKFLLLGIQNLCGILVVYFRRDLLMGVLPVE